MPGSQKISRYEARQTADNRQSGTPFRLHEILTSHTGRLKSKGKMIRFQSVAYFRQWTLYYYKGNEVYKGGGAAC